MSGLLQSASAFLYISHYAMLCQFNTFPPRLSSETVLAFLLQSDVSLSRSLPGVYELPLLRTLYCLVCIPFKTHITHYFAFSCYDVVTIPLPCWKLRFCQKVPLARHSDNPERPLSTSGHAHVAGNLLPRRYFLGRQNDWSIAFLQAPIRQCSQICNWSGLPKP